MVRGGVSTSTRRPVRCVPRAASAVNLRRVNGPVYNNSNTSPWDVSPAGLEVVDGGVVQNLTPSGCSPPAGLVLSGQGSFVCTPPVNPSPLPPPTQGLPSSPAALPLQSPNGTATTGTCRVFEPGRYQALPDLLASNYFKPGVYFFQAGWPALDGKIILGGGPTPMESRCFSLRRRGRTIGLRSCLVCQRLFGSAVHLRWRGLDLRG